MLQKKPQNAPDSDGPAEMYSDMRLPSLPGRPEILEKIMTDSIADPAVKPYRSRAQFTFFCGDKPTALAGHNSQLEVVGRCLEWFVFDYIIPELDLTPAQHWFKSYREELSPQQRNDAADCLDFILGIFEISHPDPKQGFIAIDLLRTGQSYQVCEHVINDELKPSQLLLGRIFPHHGNFILSGMAAVMSKTATKQIKQLIQSGRLKPEMILDDLDGLELENLYGRSLMEIDKIQSPKILGHILKVYLENIITARLDYNELIKMIESADDPVAVGVDICRRLKIPCRHEIELIITYIITYWFRTHLT